MRLVALVWLLTTSLVAAADFPASYTVDGQALKAAVSGTNLTFTLYTDAACTEQVFQQSVAVQNVSVISQLKLFKAPGSPTTPPKASTLNQTLSGVTTSGNLYLKVTGIGITPVGGACQAQAAAVQAPPVFQIVVKDANGTIVGIPTSNDEVVVAMPGGAASAVSDLASGFVNNGEPTLFFQSADCSGQGLVIADSRVLPSVGRQRAGSRVGVDRGVTAPVPALKRARTPACRRAQTGSKIGSDPSRAGAPPHRPRGPRGASRQW
jgi:hypothetical protein